MKRSNGIFWGGLLVLFGVAWLLRNLGYLQVEWHDISRYWPVLLILAGISLLVSGRRRGGVAGGIAGILIAVAALAGITHRTERALDNGYSNWRFDWDNDWDEDRPKRERFRDRERDESYERKYKSDRGSERGVRNRHYEYEMEDDLREATLNFEGGAGEFKLNGSTDKLFEAESRSSFGGFESTIRNNRNANTAVINFKMESGLKLKKGDTENSVEMTLNSKPLWTIDMGIGAGEGRFDLSDFRVRKLDISTGVADLNVRLGDKVERTDVKVESGVASVTLEIPESVGCEVRIDGILNDKNMGDLRQVGDGLYRSPDFDRSDRKVVVRYEAGLSEVTIRRY